jgi:hypothetical protein
MNEREALLAARRRLMTLMARIAADVERQPPERCPYRAADDGCTFPGACRNRRRVTPRREFRCSGAALNTSPAERRGA